MAEEQTDKKPRLSLKGLDLNGAIATINKKYGENTLILSSKAEGLVKRFVSTGVYALDFALGGGIPENRITEIRGGYSSLKSTVLLKTIAAFQKKYPDGKPFYVDLEHSYDPEYAKLLGVDPDRLGVIEPDSGEQACDIVTDIFALEGEIFVGLDSLAALVPTAELEGSFDKMTMGTQARLVNRLMRVATSRMKRNLYDSTAPTTTLVIINQFRKKIGVMFGNPETTPGGEGKDYAYSTILTLRSTPSNAIKENKEVQGIKKEVRLGQTVRFKVEKNKMSSSQFEEGEFDYFVRDVEGHKAYTFNNIETLLRYGLFYQVIEINDKRMTYGTISRGREKEFIKDLKANPKIARKLYKEILEKVIQTDEDRTEVVEVSK